MRDYKTLKETIIEQSNEIKSLQIAYQALYDLHQEVTDRLRKIQEVVNEGGL